MRAPTPVPRVRDYLRIVAKYWPIILVATVLSAAAGWFAHRDTEPNFLSTTRVMVVAPGSAEVFDAYYGHLAAAGRANSIAQLAKNPQVAKRTVDQLHLDETPTEVSKRVTTSVRDTVVEITVSGDTPQLAHDTANSILFNFMALSDEMGDLEKSGTDVVVVDTASNPFDARPPVTKYLQLGGGIGFALSLVMVIAYGRVRGEVLSEEQVARIVKEEESAAEGKA